MLHLYAKFGALLDGFDGIINVVGVSVPTDFTHEHAASWLEFDKLTDTCVAGDLIAVLSLPDLGPDVNNMIRRIGYVILRSCRLLIAGIPATYEFGVSESVNRAALSAVTQGLAAGGGFSVSAGGRPQVQFPDGWPELYAAWSAGKITSARFLADSGLKKATFYNKLADYKKLLDENAAYCAIHDIHVK